MRALALAVCLFPLAALAQTDDRSYLTALLEDNLSGEGRKVVVTGFEGALSSQARIAELTIADSHGVWLTLRDVALDWNRAALLSGEVSVNALTAAEITLARLPDAGEQTPSPEAGTFALPELPVSVQIGNLEAGNIILGPSVLGQPVEGRLAASLSLEGGEGAAELLLERTDTGPEGRIAFEASYSNVTGDLVLNLSAVEAAGGIAASKLGLPGLPSASLEITGEGPISDYSAKVSLSTDGTARLAGTVELSAGSQDATVFSATLAGDLAPLFLPDYAAFLGNRLSLRAKGTSHADGRLDLSDFDLSARALALSGRISLGPDRQPRVLGIKGRIAQPDGTAVLLPLTTDQPVRVQSAEIALGFDAVKSDGWTGEARITSFDTAAFRASQLALNGSGRMLPHGFGATFRFDAEGLAPTDRALAEALGPFVSGDAVLFWDAGKDRIAVPKLRLSGQEYAATITGASLDGLTEGLAVSGRLTAELQDMSRLSGLAGQPLGGAALLEVAGDFTPLTGAFDLELVAQGTDMRIGQPEVDGLLRGQATLRADVVRQTSGTTLRSLAVEANNLSATAQGRFATTGNDVVAQVSLGDLSVLGKGYGGRISGDLHLTGTASEGALLLRADGANLRIGQVEADRLLAGASRVEADLTLAAATLHLDRVLVQNPQVEIRASGALDDQTRALKLDARLQNLGLLVPEFPGPLSVTGTVVQDGAGALVDLAGRGPGGIEAKVAGRLASGYGSGDLTITGRAQAALANAFISPRAVSGGVGFDLRLRGAFDPQALSGTVTLSQGRLADPALDFAAENLALKADLSGGRANVTSTLSVSTGGNVGINGTIGLAEPYSAALSIELQRVKLRDPDLYETEISGGVDLSGPLSGGARIAGALSLAETEIRVPKSGLSGSGGIPDLRHRTEPAAVRATRARAGVLEALGKNARSSAAVYALDIAVSAPRRLFVRGRGLDAELGGSLRLLGTTADVRPAGAFNLIRGRLDILGKRLDLDEALLQMEGELVPFLLIRASTENDGIESSVNIEGPADDPVVSFTSSPELPEEEVLAQLLFGQGLQNLTAFQALQLANAVATLAGKGGDGIVSRLRKGFGLDNFDVKTKADGGTEVTAGKYLNKNIYSEVTVDQTGQSQINLNLDVTDQVTIKGRATSDGSAGLGIYLEKDY